MEGPVEEVYYGGSKIVICEQCLQNITLHTEIYRCLECEIIFWCRDCFYKTTFEVNKYRGQPDGYDTPNFSVTRGWHIHPFTVIKVEIYSPEGKFEVK